MHPMSREGWDEILQSHVLDHIYSQLSHLSAAFRFLLGVSFHGSFRAPRRAIFDNACQFKSTKKLKGIDSRTDIAVAVSGDHFERM